VKFEIKSKGKKAGHVSRERSEQAEKCELRKGGAKEFKKGSTGDEKKLRALRIQAGKRGRSEANVAEKPFPAEGVPVIQGGRR